MEQYILYDRVHLGNINLANSNSNLVAFFLDARFMQAKVLDTHKQVDLQMTIMRMAHQARGFSSIKTNTVNTEIEIEH